MVGVTVRITIIKGHNDKSYICRCTDVIGCRSSPVKKSGVHFAVIKNLSVFLKKDVNF